MSTIRVLSDDVANRIAAGEVIERPASVVKELVENAIDAGAKNICVAIENAGSALISVTDDGCGMDEDDALLCFEPHGTSKISTDADLHRICSYGFRGEAVPSIASVSHTALRTRRRENTSGFEVRVDGGVMNVSRPIGCAAGTEFAVRDLFYNVPARRKFLKSPPTEEHHIYETFLNMALPNASISFELRLNGRIAVHSPQCPEDLMPRLQAFFGRAIADELLPVDTQCDTIHIRGYIARHGVTKTSRREQRFYVNGRAIEALALYNGVRDGYGGLLEKGCYPQVVLFIDIPPEEIDVNVHPAKREIRFHRERLVTGAVAACIRETLEQSSAPAAAIDSAIPLRSLFTLSQVQYTPEEHLEQKPLPLSDQPFREPTPPPIVHIPETMQTPVSTLPLQTQNPPAPAAEQPMSPQSAPAPAQAQRLPLQALGILCGTYILAQTAEGLILIDQHAAHERILFERFLRRAEAGKEPEAIEQLLFPVTVTLSPMEINLVRAYETYFEQAGFAFTYLGKETILLSCVPAAMPHENIPERFHTLLLDLLDERDNPGKLTPLAQLARAACHAAVKAHDELTLTEANALIAQMGQCAMPFSCPHGRPTLIQISLKELEKRFGRRA